ncbi:MAG: RimK/LysX family protein [Cyclobacteriaceae bacterium]
MKNKITIGRTDKIDLPDFEIFDVNAKIDTGAYTSAIHCIRINLIDGILHFQIPGLMDHQVLKDFTTNIYTTKRVRSSNGKTETRYSIKTHVLLFGHLYYEEFTLTDRSKMKNPILLGRKVLRNRFVVDVSKKNLSFNLKYQ